LEICIASYHIVAGSITDEQRGSYNLKKPHESMTLIYKQGDWRGQYRLYAVWNSEITLLRFAGGEEGEQPWLAEYVRPR